MIAPVTGVQKVKMPQRVVGTRIFESPLYFTEIICNINNVIDCVTDKQFSFADIAGNFTRDVIKSVIWERMCDKFS